MSYDAALTHPFHPKAKGARVPDEFVFPTTVYSTTVNYTVNCDSNGDADFLVCPNPFVGICASICNTNPLAPTLHGIQNGPTEVRNFAGLVANTTGLTASNYGATCELPSTLFPASGASTSGTQKWIAGKMNPDHATGQPTPGVLETACPGYSGEYCPALDATSMAAFMCSWRLVGMGIRVRSLPAPQSQSGQFQVATVPCPEVLANPATSQFPNWLVANSFPVQAPTTGGTALLQASLIQYPASDMYMFAELTREGGLEWISRRSGPRADQFHGSSSSVNLGSYSRVTTNTPAADPPTSTAGYTTTQSTNQSIGYPIAGSSQAAVIGKNYDEYGFSCSGWSAFFCRMNGLPKATAGTVAPVVNVEVIYHLEGQPNITSTGGLVPNVARGIYDATYFSACCMKASQEPWFRRVIDYDRFSGRVVDSNAPLQVAMSGLLGSQRPQKISSKSRGLKRRFY